MPSAVASIVEAVRPKLQVRPQRPIYRALTALTWGGSAVLVWLWIQNTKGMAHGAAGQLGRIYGLVGAVIFLYLVYYGFRRISYYTGVLNQEWWYRGHLLLGWLSLVMVGCHAWNLNDWTRSPFLIALQIGFWGTMATGLYGWVYLTLLKRWMLRHEYRPTVRKELERSRAALLAELDQLKADSGSAQSGLSQNMRGQAIDRAVGQMTGRRMTHIWRLPPLDFWEKEIGSIARALDALPKEAVRPIQELNRIEVLRSYHKGLRAWTNLHLILAAIGIQMMLWHVLAVSLWPR
ncbi:MAG: hypothetical protein FJX77_11390 [Armatimonadetes bacterium]|nr:hypothetical protein [Armatimonadota bacterium]